MKGTRKTVFRIVRILLQKDNVWLCKFLVCANDKRHGKAVLWVPAGECRTKIVPGGPAGLKNVGNIYTPRGCWDWILIRNHIHTRTLYHQCRQFQGFFFIYLLAATIRFYLLFLFGKLKALQYNNRALNSNILITYFKLFMMYCTKLLKKIKYIFFCAVLRITWIFIICTMNIYLTMA